MTSTGCMKWRHLRSTKCIQWLDSFLGISQKSFLWVWSHLLKKSSVENFIFCAVINILFVVFVRIIINVLIIKLLESFTGSYHALPFEGLYRFFLRRQKLDLKKVFKFLGLTIFYCHKNDFYFDFATPLKIYSKVNQKIIYMVNIFNLTSEHLFP